MNDSNQKIKKIQDFIDEFMMWSQKKGQMFGSLEVVEHNWILLDHIYFILHDLYDEQKKYNFHRFLDSKGFGAKDATTVIQEKNVENPYLELNKLWEEYLEWRQPKIEEILKAREKSK